MRTLKAQGTRHALWVANLLLVAGLLLLAVAATWLERLPLLSGPSAGRTVVALVLALLPPLLWLVLFYRLDRADPEPLEAIGKAALLGALAQQAVCAPLLSLFPNWTSLSGWPQSLADAGGVFAVSAIRIACVLLVLRWGVFPIAEFNERTDGILYGSAIGLGFSAAMNVAWVLSSGDMLLSAAVPRMVVTSLIQASLGGLGGYWFGLSAFARQPLWRLTIKLLLLSGLGAGLQILPAMAARKGFLFRHLVTLLPSAAGALLIFLLLILLLRKAQSVTLEKIPRSSTRRDSILLVSLLVVAVFAGFSLRAWQTRLIPVTPAPGVRLTMPANWQVMVDPVCSFSAGDRFSGGAQVGSIRLTVTKLDAGLVPVAEMSSNAGTMGKPDARRTTVPLTGAVSDPEGEDRIRGLAAWWTIRHARQVSWWKPVSTEFLYRNGNWMAVVKSLRLEEGSAGNGGIPVIRQARDVLWLQGSDVVHVSLYVANRDGTADEKRMAALVASIWPEMASSEGGDAP